MNRHLLYFLWPAVHSWKWNLDQLRPRMGLFNGQTVACVAVGGVPVREPRTRKPAIPVAPFSEVFDELKKMGFQTVFTVENDPAIGEVAGWKALWSRVLPAGPNDAIFYAHGKGARRETHPTCRRWAEIMYETCLDYWPMVEILLGQYALAGSLKKIGHWAYHSNWHYTGTFFWARGDAVTSKTQWMYPQKIWAGTEAHPGELFKSEEAGIIFHGGPKDQIEMYCKEYVFTVVEQLLQSWKAFHEQYRRTSF